MPNRPLTVFHDVAHCDTKHEHPIILTTDGLRAYAHGPETTVEAVLRNGRLIEVTCPELDGTCHGVVTFDLTTPGTWTADPARTALLDGAPAVEFHNDHPAGVQ